MSEFSSGIMIQTCHKDIALNYMGNKTYLIQLNDYWLCRLSENDDDYSEKVLNLSEHIPLLHVINAEDHCFILHILYHKKNYFSFSILYYFETEFAFDLVEKLYGYTYIDQMRTDDHDALDNKIDEEIEKHRDEIKEEIQSFFSEINAEQINKFRLFGFSQNVCEKLLQILTYQNYQKDGSGHKMIYEFLAAIRLENFVFISYNYVTSSKEDFLFLS